MIPAMWDASAFQLEEEQHIIGHQPSPAEHLNREEIAPRQHVHMSGEKVLPGGDLASFGSRSNAMPTQNILHRLIRHPMTQVGKGTDDAVIAPARVLSRHPNNQGFDF